MTRHTSGPAEPDLRAIFDRQDQEFSSELESQGTQRESELRRRIAEGDAGPDTLFELANLLDTEAGIALLRKSYEYLPSLPILYRLISYLENANRTEEGVRMAEEGLRRWPGDATLRVGEALLLPIVYESADAVARWRGHYAEGLERLNRDFRRDLDRMKDGIFRALRGHVNFQLASQAANDRELQRLYGRLVHDVLAAVHPESAAPVEVTRPQGERIRLGYVSAHFREHSVMKSHGAWLLEADRTRFEVFAYQIHKPANRTSEEFRKAADHFQVLAGDFASVSAAIRADGLHAAVFLDVGMIPQMSLLAASRVAPVQCSTWGHPETTGSPTIDAYFSSELMEPPDGDEHYTEELVRLPGIGVCYQKPLIPRPLIDARRPRFGLRTEAVVFLCCQSAWKYLPARDHVLVEIARRVPAAQFVFLAHRAAIGAALEARLGKAFRDGGLDAERHLVFLPVLGKLDYWGLNLAADVFLDSFDWSGFNTTMEAIACGLPVVTMPGRFMRGRHSSAILTQLGVTETIARDEVEYVELAVRLAAERERRARLRDEIGAAAGRLFSDLRSVRAVEEWIALAVTGRQGFL